MPNKLPIVTVATACDSILQERDGTLSAIRIIDLITIRAIPLGPDKRPVSPDAAPKIPQGELPVEVQMQVKALICLKSGDYRGEGVLSLAIQLPDGSRKDLAQTWKLHMLGDEQGVNVNLELFLNAKRTGLSWIEVMWNGEFLTKFPIKVVLDEQIPEATGKQP